MAHYWVLPCVERWEVIKDDQAEGLMGEEFHRSLEVGEMKIMMVWRYRSLGGPGNQLGMV